MNILNRIAVSAALLLVGGVAQGGPVRLLPYQKPANSYVAPRSVSATCDAGPTTDLCIPVDATFSVATFSGSDCGNSTPGDPCGRNDDDFTTAIALPFTFHFYGQAYTTVYLNNNGNVSFNAGFCAYTATGFPDSEFAMVAPFWADADTRNPASGVVHYRVDAHKLVVAWDHVGYFPGLADMRNTFELVLSDGTDPAIPPGNNLCMCYGDMQWWTGVYGDGLPGAPATAGANAGDGVHFFQIGRFDHPGDDYDGPGGATDGFDYLDHQRFCVDVSGQNVPPVAVGFPAALAETLCVADTFSLATSFAAPELEQTVVTSVDFGGMAGASASTISGNLSTQLLVLRPALEDVGAHVIRYTAVDDGSPAETTLVSLAVVVNRCGAVGCSPTNHAPRLLRPACALPLRAFVNQAMTMRLEAGDADAQDVVTLTASGLPAGVTLTPALPATGNPATASLSWTPGAEDVGTHVVTFRTSDGCDSSSCEVPFTVLEQALCPRPANFWAQHSSAWPADSLRLGNRVYGPASLEQFLLGQLPDPGQGDAALLSLHLATELVAAKFNLLAGAAAPAAGALVAQSDRLIGNRALPFEIRCGRHDHDDEEDREDREDEGRGEDRDGSRGRSRGATRESRCARTIAGITQATDSLAMFNSALLSPYCQPGLRLASGRSASELTGPAANESQAGTRPGALAFSVDARPNPFRGATTIAYTLPEAADVRIVLYDLQGREVRVLADSRVAAGPHESSWDGADASGQKLRSGVYFYRLTAGPYSSGKKLIVQQ